MTSHALGGEDVCSPWAVDIAADLDAHGDPGDLHRPGDLAIGLVMISFPEARFVGDVDLAVGMTQRAPIVEDQGGVAADTVITSDEASADEPETCFGSGFGLHAGQGPSREFLIGFAGLVCRGTPAVAAQLGQDGYGRTALLGFREAFHESGSTVFRMKRIADQGNRESLAHARECSRGPGRQAPHRAREDFCRDSPVPPEVPVETRMAETGEHRELKRLACRWLREHGHVAVGMEVTDPTGRFRVDVAAWTDREPSAQGVVRARPRTVLVECKRSRSDYLRDGARASGLMARRTELIEALAERGLQPASLFSRVQGDGATLFDDRLLDPDRPGRAVRRLRIELTSIERRVFRGVKFARLARWRVATRLWVAAPEGMLSPCELPVGWGLLEAPHKALQGTVPEGVPASSVIRPRIRAPELTVTEGFVARTLRNIAVANSRYVGGRAALVKSGHQFDGFWSTSGGSRAG